MGRHHCPSTFLHSRRTTINLSKMSEVDAKTDAPTAEEIKGTKRAAEDEEAKKQKTEKNGSSNGKAVEVENGAEEEEEDVEGEDDEGEEEEDGEGEEEEEGDE